MIEIFWKQKKTIFIILILFALGISYFFFKISQNELYNLNSKTEFVLGSTFKISIYGKDSDRLIQESIEIVNEIDNKMSLNNSESEINKINNNAGIEFSKVSDDTFYVVSKAVEYGDISKGYFDISIAPLVNLWGITSDSPQVPSESEINQALSLINYKDIEFEENKIKLKREKMGIDLGGIAKGFAADKVYNHLNENGVKSAIIDVGGNISLLGTRPDGSEYTIGIQNPFESRGNHFATVKIADKTIVTSGKYERFFTYENKDYHHILSPFDGYPIENNIESVTIISENSLEADALSTTVLLLGTEKGLELINSLKDSECIIVDSNKNVFLSNSLKNFELKNNEFNLKTK